MAQLIEKERPRAESIVAGVPFSDWKGREQASFYAWTEFFSKRINGLELSDVPALLDVAKSEVSVETITLEQGGHIGKNERWPFLEPLHDTVSLSSVINKSFPDLMPQIDGLATSLELDRSLLLLGIIRTNALLDLTRFDSPPVGKDLEVGAAALVLGDGKRNIRLRKFSLPIFNGSAFVGGSIGYYSVIRIREQGLRPREADCHSLIFAQGLPEPIDFANIFPWVLCFSSHAAVGDAYYKFLQQERLRIQSQS